MSKFVAISGSQCFIFETEQEEQAHAHLKEELGSSEYTLSKIESINIQHEIVFEMSKKFKDMVNEEAIKNRVQTLKK